MTVKTSWNKLLLLSRAVTGSLPPFYFSKHIHMAQEVSGFIGNVVLILRNKKMLQVAPLITFMSTNLTPLFLHSKA